MPPKWIQVCTAIGHCKNHPMKFILIDDTTSNTVNTDTLSAQSVSLDSCAYEKTAELSVDRHDVVHIKHHKIDTSLDTIQPCDVSLLQQGTYHVPKINVVRTSKEIDTPMNYDLLANSMVFSFMLWISAKYVIASIPCWKEMFNEINQLT
jgi:hypothetical protein